MSEREQFEIFLLELDALLGREVQDEDSYQRLLERHRIVFQVLGYVEVIPQPRLISGSQEMIPDFLVRRDDRVWEVFELKRPDTKIVRPGERRRQLYADCESYVSQCGEYAQYFDDEANRARFRERYGVDVQKGVPSVLVAGRADGVQELAAHCLLHHRNGHVRLRTYDSLRSSVVASRALAFGKRDSRAGFSAHMIVRPWKASGTKNHLFEVLDCARGTALALLIDEEDNLCLELLEDVRRSTLARAPMRDYEADYEVWHYLSIDVASTEDRTLISMEVDARRFCDRLVDPVPWALSEDSRLAAGAPREGDGICSFDLSELLILKDTLALDERLRMRRYYLDRRSTTGAFTEWRGRARMETR